MPGRHNDDRSSARLNQSSSCDYSRYHFASWYIRGWRKSDKNGNELTTVREAIASNDVKTEEVGKAVNGRMTALLEEIEKRHANQLGLMEKRNAETLAEAVKAARLDSEKIALAHINELQVQIASARTDKDIRDAIEQVQSKLLSREG